ncbi:hypothetical protein [Palleronia sp. LCG004]|uniref:hypothetical protein n=1 Tax=Palleronia sp. LCG004 TaxID=3079304 RepID=UPI002942A83F|nr:hypothetical protein [Palleronia sp. LCG004]WOI55294.1 hypothetical protein RVY76_09555 [Palleronia sp. LCG004]
MSAPKTNVEKQKRRHKVPLAGMAWMIGFAVVLLILLVLYLSAGGNEPGDEEGSVDPTAGAGSEASATE